MAHQFTSPASGSSCARQGGVLISALPSAYQTSLDLNLSQKASQNPYKGRDETESLHQEGFKASTSSQLYSVSKASEVLTSIARGSTSPNAKDLSEQSVVDEQEHAHGLHPLPKQDTDSVTASTRTGLDDTLVTAVDERLPMVSESALISAGQKWRSPRVEAASNAQNELVQGGTIVPLKDAAVLVNEPMPIFPGSKRKGPRVKQTTSINKKVMLALEANDDQGSARPKGRPRGNSDISRDGILDMPRLKSSNSWTAKGGSPDLAERHLLLEERKVRLAEQRFLLEEKKLDATIEIGRGLIISMDRMTTTISQLGGFSSYHH